MKQTLNKHLLIIAGWFFVILGAIGAFLPLIPTTPLLIVALVLFSKSSPRFHQMLLNNKWFGPGLRQWEATKTISRETKKRATLLIVITFAISIAVLYQKLLLQIMLVGIAMTLLFSIWRIKESSGAALEHSQYK